MFDDPANVRRLLFALYAACAVLIGLDLVNLVLHAAGAGSLRHAERSWEAFPGFYAFYGFVACVSLVLIAKELRKLILRSEDYYDR